MYLIRLSLSSALTATLVLAGAAVASATGLAAPTPKFHVIVSGLSNPRSLAAGKGQILVAEAGTGGSSCVGTGAAKACFGQTGSIVGLRTGSGKAQLSTVVGGLMSVSTSEGVTGPDAVAYSTTTHHIYTVETDSSAIVPAGLPPQIAVQAYNQLGRVLDVTPGHGGELSPVGDPGDYDYAWAEQHKNLAPKDFPDANPYGLLITSNTQYLSDAAFVVDAGANTLDVVINGQVVGPPAVGGTVRILAFIPNSQVGDAVPPVSLRARIARCTSAS